MHILKEKTIVLKITQLFQKQALINRVVLGPVANGAIFAHVVITFSPCQIFPYYVFPFQNTAVGCPLQSQQVTVVCVCAITVQANTDLGSPAQQSFSRTFTGALPELAYGSLVPGLAVL